jgi:hypothetical protein
MRTPRGFQIVTLSLLLVTLLAFGGIAYGDRIGARTQGADQMVALRLSEFAADLSLLRVLADAQGPHGGGPCESAIVEARLERLTAHIDASFAALSASPDLRNGSPNVKVLRRAWEQMRVQQVSRARCRTAA